MLIIDHLRPLVRIPQILHGDLDQGLGRPLP